MEEELQQAREGSGEVATASAAAVEEITMPARQAAAEEEEEEPSWAAKWKVDKQRPPKVLGTCAKWNKGFGFIKRDDGGPDLYVHQRELQKHGFRSLLEGERLEFDVEPMADGRLQAVRVSGPNGVDVTGQPKPERHDSDDSDDEKPRAGKAPKLAASSSGGAATAAAKKPLAKPSFVPRAVARPKAPPPKPKPKPPPPAAPPAPES